MSGGARYVDYYFCRKGYLPSSLLWCITPCHSLVCHTHQSSTEVCFLCCNLAFGTLDPQDSGMEHQRTTETRTACPHLGNIAYCIRKCGDNWIVDAAAYNRWMRSKHDFVFFTLYTSWSGKILHFLCLRPRGAVFGPVSFDLTCFWARLAYPFCGSCDGMWQKVYRCTTWFRPLRLLARRSVPKMLVKLRVKNYPRFRNWFRNSDSQVSAMQKFTRFRNSETTPHPIPFQKLPPTQPPAEGCGEVRMMLAFASAPNMATTHLLLRGTSGLGQE